MVRAGLPLMVYVGQYDFENNAIGQERWMKGISWGGQGAWEGEPFKPWVLYSGSDQALVKSVGALSLVVFQNIGHYTVRERPKELQLAIS